MKSFLFLFLLVVFFSSCGTTGHILFYNFSQSKYDVEKDILHVINKNTDHKVSEKWKDCGKGDYFERIYVYFISDSEELYQIGFVGNSKDWNASPTCRLGLIAQYDGNIWRYESDLSRKEIGRITKRFEQEVLSKLQLNYYKSE